MNTRLKDIAEATGYSLMTVSLALNPRKSGTRISEATRKKIEAAARKMNYRPNMTARILSGGKSQVIGVMFNIVRDGFFTDLVQSIDSALRQNGYTGFYTFWGNEEEFQRSLEAMHQYKVAGILTGHDIPADYPDVPVICYGVCHKDYESVYPREADLAACSVQYALRHGYRKLGFVGSINNIPRGRAVRNMLREHRLEMVFFYSAKRNAPPDAGVDQLLKNPAGLPEVLIFGNDQCAVEWMAEIQSRGIRLPDDMKVIGINNSSICDNVSPRLTSVDFQLGRLGDLLVGRLLRHCDDPGLPREDVILPVRIEERNSCPAVSNVSIHHKITIN